jgi:hypothetical protein
VFALSWQSLSDAHAVLHAVPLAQMKPPGQAVVVPPLHAPDPSQRPAGVRRPLLHVTAPHEVLELACSQTPPEAHLPSLPQVVVTAHWPAGAVVPARMLLHVPVGWPVSEIEHAWQLPLHAVLQQTPLPAGPTQLPCAHCAAAVHDCPSGRSWQVVLPWQNPLWQSAAVPQPWLGWHVLFWASHCGPPQSVSVSLPSFVPSTHETHVPGPLPKQKLFLQSELLTQCSLSAHFLLAASQVAPPQSVSVSAPFFTPSLHVAGVHVFAVGSQTPLTQSPATRHLSLSAHAEHEPPQSLSVSSASWTPSVQCVATHAPLPSQTMPPLSEQTVPLETLLVPQVCAVASHVFTLHAVVCAGQSVGARHATHLPLPSQTLPPLSVHVVPLVASLVPHLLLVQVSRRHAVLCGAQSVGWAHATHLPLPSQTLPLLSVHVAPAGALLVPQVLLLQVSTTHAVVCPGQSVGWVQPTQLPFPSQTFPPFDEQVVPAATFDVPHVLAVQVGFTQSPAEGQSAGLLQPPEASVGASVPVSTVGVASVPVSGVGGATESTATSTVVASPVGSVVPPSMRERSKVTASSHPPAKSATSPIAPIAAAVVSPSRFVACVFVTGGSRLQRPPMPSAQATVGGRGERAPTRDRLKVS